MKIILFVFCIPLVVGEYFKETQNFQYSRSSPDEGTKKGFYESQTGNMGGNYEVARNMDTLAQRQLTGLKHQVGSQLGIDPHNIGTGAVEHGGPTSVYGSATSSGTIKGNLADYDSRNHHSSNAYNANQRGYSSAATSGSRLAHSSHNVGVADVDYDDSQRTVDGFSNAGNQYSNTQHHGNSYVAGTTGTRHTTGSRYYDSTAAGSTLDGSSNVRYESGPYIPKASRLGTATSNTQYQSGSSSSYHATSGAQTFRDDNQGNTRVNVPSGGVKILTVPAYRQSSDSHHGGYSDVTSSNREYESAGTHGTVVRPNYVYRPVAPNSGRTATSQSNYNVEQSHSGSHHSASESTHSEATAGNNVRTVYVQPGSKVNIAVVPNQPVKIQLPAQATRQVDYTRTHAQDQHIDSASHVYEEPSHGAVPTGNTYVGHDGQAGGTTGRRYHSEYSYSKEWQKQGTAGDNVGTAHTVPIASTSNLHNVAQNRDQLVVGALDLGVNNQNTAGSRVTSTANRYGSTSHAQHESRASEYRGDTDQQAAGSAYVNSNVGAHNTGANVNQYSTQPKSYQTSYSYHKAWERHGDPYYILPSGETVPITSESHTGSEASAHAKGDTATSASTGSRYTTAQHSASSHASGAQYGSTQSANHDQESMNAQMNAMQERLREQMGTMCTDCGGTKTKGYSASYSYSAQRSYGGNQHNNYQDGSRKSKREASYYDMDDEITKTMKEIEEQIDALRSDLHKMVGMEHDYDEPIPHVKTQSTYPYVAMHHTTYDTHGSYPSNTEYAYDFHRHRPVYTPRRTYDRPSYHSILYHQPEISDHHIIVIPETTHHDSDCAHDESPYGIPDKEYETDHYYDKDPKSEVEQMSPSYFHPGKEAEDMGQETEDWGQQSEFIGQETTDSKPQFGRNKKPIYSQRTEDIGQKSQGFGYGTEYIGQNTENFRQPQDNIYQKNREVTDQQNKYDKISGFQIGRRRPQYPSKPIQEDTEDMGQQTEDFGQQPEDLGQVTTHFTLPPKPYLQLSSTKPKENLQSKPIYIGQQPEVIGQETEDLGQQTEDLGQQMEEIGQQPHEPLLQLSSTKPKENLQSTPTYIGQETEDLGQQTEDLGQQIEEIGQQPHEPLLQLSSTKPKENLQRKPAYIGQETEDLGQQIEDLRQQIEEIGQLPYKPLLQLSSTKPKENLQSNPTYIGQETEDLGQQSEDLGQQTEDLGQQLENTRYENMRHPHFQISNLHLSNSKPNNGQNKKTEDVGQQETKDLGQQTETDDKLYDKEEPKLNLEPGNSKLNDKPSDQILVGPHNMYNYENPGHMMSSVMHDNEFFGQKAMKEQYGHQQTNLPHNNIYPVNKKLSTTTENPKNDAFFKHHGKSEQEKTNENEHLESLLKILGGGNFNNDGHTLPSKMNIVQSKEIKENHKDVLHDMQMQRDDDQQVLQVDDWKQIKTEDITKSSDKLKISDQVKPAPEQTTPINQHHDQKEWYNQQSFLDAYITSKEQKHDDERKKTTTEAVRVLIAKEPLDTQKFGTFDEDDGQQVQENVWDDGGQQTVQEKQFDIGQQLENGQLNTDDGQQKVIDNVELERIQVNENVPVPTTAKPGFWSRTKDKVKGWFS